MSSYANEVNKVNIFPSVKIQNLVEKIVFLCRLTIVGEIKIHKSSVVNIIFLFEMFGCISSR